MHVNAELAATLVKFKNTGLIDSGTEREAARKGLIAPAHKGGGLVLTNKGEEFLSKWSSS